MIASKLNWIVVLELILVLGLVGCSNAATPSNQPPPAQATMNPTPTYALATPYAQEPAAGICASFDGEQVTITLTPDVPSPRCARVRPDQKLTVINQMLGTVNVSIAQFSFSLLPGAEYTIDVPFGDYLALGVHRLLVSQYYNVELWLEAVK